MKYVEKDESTQTLYLKNARQILGWDIGTINEILPFPLYIELTKINLFCEKLEAKKLEGLLTGEEIELLKNEKARATQILSDMMLSDHGEDDILEALHSAMPKRTESMIETLRKVMALPNIAKIFLITGEAHLRENEGEEDERMKLHAFHDFIRDKDAIMLFPKDEPCQMQ